VFIFCPTVLILRVVKDPEKKGMKQFVAGVLVEVCKCIFCFEFLGVW